VYYVERNSDYVLLDTIDLANIFNIFKVSADTRVMHRERLVVG